MKTLVDISKINDLNCGLGQFAYYLQQELYKLDKDLIFYADEKSKDRVLGQFMAKRKWHRNMFFFRPSVDIWHGIHQDCDVYPAKKSIKRILTIQDLNFIYENQDEAKQAKYLSMIQEKIDRSDAITYISEFTKSEVEKYLNVKSINSLVVSNGICVKEEGLGSVTPRVKELVTQLGNDFLFGIGTVVPKKNYKLAIEMALQKDDLKIVVAGTTFHSYAKEFSEEIRKHNLGDRVFLIGEITEADKLYLYQQSKAFFHPSFLEGFGLPVIEAMYLGKPVVCSNVTSLPEVTGGLAYMFDPNVAEEAVAAVGRCWNDIEEGTLDASLLRSHASQYSWEKAAKQYDQLYKTICP